ncbi:MAG TPA: hypothetical protein VIZ69_09280 [Thermoanaerobaculia bacterium]
MQTIRRALVLSTVLLLGSATLFAQTEAPRRFSNRMLGDVVQMTRAGLSEATIIAYVKARRSRLEVDVTADDLIQLRRSGVSENVVRYIAGAVNLQVPEGSDREVTYESRGGSSGAAQPVDGEDYAVDGPYTYGWYPYPYAYGYPYWYAYSPYFATGVFIGGGFRGRGFGHRSFGHGGHFGGGHFGGGHRGGGGGHGRR